MRYAFLGNMNNLSFVFARELRKQNLDVVLFVDADQNYMLDRPEGFDNCISFPYPNWIVELDEKKKKQIKRLFLLPFYKKQYLKLLRNFDVIILNGDWISLGKYLPANKKVINFYGGYDMDILSDYSKLEHLLNMQPRKIVLKFFKPLFSLIYSFVIYQQRGGLRRADGINYYPTGINPAADKIICEVKKNIPYKKLELRGFPFDDLQFEPFLQKSKFVILNFTRFDFLNEERIDNKRNDIMIKGIASFIKNNHTINSKNLEIIFFEKGQDLKEAKKLCIECGIAEYILWQKPVTQQELKSFIINADVVFDQLGKQWLGYGIAAMSIGRPVIANGRADVFDLITGENSPVCNAISIEEVSRWLSHLHNHKEKKIEIGLKSSIYIQKHYDIQKTIDFILNI